MIQEKIINDLDELVKEGNKVLETAVYHGLGGADGYYECNRTLYMIFMTQSLSYLKRIVGSDDDFYEKFKELSIKDSYKSNVEISVGILNSLKRSIENGRLFNLKNLVASEIFSDFLDMAQYLLREGYKDAAAVIVGGVLEEHLRQMAIKNKIDLTFMNRKGQEKNKAADTLNTDIVKIGAYTKLDQKQVTAWLDLRNNAAHGKYSEYSQDQVELMYQGVLNFVTRNQI